MFKQIGFLVAIFLLAVNPLTSLEITLAQKSKSWIPQSKCYLIHDTYNDNQVRSFSKEQDLVELLENHEFEGNTKDMLEFTEIVDNELSRNIFIGLGALEGNPYDILERLRRAVGKLITTLKKNNISSCKLHLPAELSFWCDPCEILKEITIASYLANYSFDWFSAPEHPDIALQIELECDEDRAACINEKIIEGTIIGSTINQVRIWSDLSANIATPKFLAKRAEELSVQYGCTCTVFGKKEAQRLGMGGFLAVGKGSAEKPKFIIVEHHTDKKDAPTIALVGKGVCFDSGGLSLKPTSGMITMKYDMCGAAAVLATVFICAQLNVPVNVIAIAPAVENKTGEKCYRPSDLITFMNGTVVEIKNTDAEGRNILADGLCYAEKFYNPDVIIDIATLTGACVAALGHFYSGLMTRDDQLSEELVGASIRTGDRVWRMPLSDDFLPALESDFGDVSHTGKRAYSAGHITASLFLEHFVEKTRWAHLDIAGPAFNVPNISYLSSKYATGAGIRLLTDFILNYTNDDLQEEDGDCDEDDNAEEE